MPDENFFEIAYSLKVEPGFRDWHSKMPGTKRLMAVIPAAVWFDPFMALVCERKASRAYARPRGGVWQSQTAVNANNYQSVISNDRWYDLSQDMFDKAGELEIYDGFTAVGVFSFGPAPANDLKGRVLTMKKS